nr:MAG TPA: Non-structural protein 5B, NS5B domain, NS5B protein, Hepatitis [Caudoviricetes sp.]
MIYKGTALAIGLFLFLLPARFRPPLLAGFLFGRR